MIWSILAGIAIGFICFLIGRWSVPRGSDHAAIGILAAAVAHEEARKSLADGVLSNTGEAA